MKKYGSLIWYTFSTAVCAYLAYRDSSMFYAFLSGFSFSAALDELPTLHLDIKIHGKNKGEK